jgi:hypothetical protein
MPAQQPGLKMAFKNSIPGLEGAAGRRRLQLSRQELGVVLTPAITSHKNFTHGKLVPVTNYSGIYIGNKISAPGVAS